LWGFIFKKLEQMQKAFAADKKLNMFSPAKLNLGLRIVGRRPDGYHLLESLFWPVDFGDELSCSIKVSPKHKLPQSESLVFYEWADSAPFKEPLLFQGSNTLVGQVLRDFELRNVDTQADFYFKKRIPIGSGLGGISSNVGAVLRFLIQQGAISPSEARESASKFGADIPFFLDPKPSWVSGVGEKTMALNLEPGVKENFFFLLFVFPFSISTPFLFEQYRKDRVIFSPASHTIPKITSWSSLCCFLESTQNDLESLAVQHFPLVGELLTQLRKTGALYCGLSGTGPTCFAIFEDPGKRVKIAKGLMEKIRDLPCRSVFADSY